MRSTTTLIDDSKPTIYDFTCWVVYSKYAMSHMRLYATCRCFSQQDGRVAGLYLYVVLLFFDTQMFKKIFEHSSLIWGRKHLLQLDNINNNNNLNVFLISFWVSHSEDFLDPELVDDVATPVINYRRRTRKKSFIVLSRILGTCKVLQ